MGEYALHYEVDPEVPCDGLICTSIWPLICTNCDELPMDLDEEDDEDDLDG